MPPVDGAAGTRAAEQEDDREASQTQDCEQAERLHVGEQHGLPRERAVQDGQRLLRGAPFRFSFSFFFPISLPFSITLPFPLGFHLPLSQPGLDRIFKG